MKGRRAASWTISRYWWVDDDESSCTHAGMLLKKMGIDAEWVQQGSEAIQMVLKAHEEYRDYNVCLIDWKMPGMNGIEVTRRIRKELGPDTLVIIISSYDWSEIEHEAKEAGSMPLLQSRCLNPPSTRFWRPQPARIML